MSTLERLAARVRAVNRAHEYGRDIMYPALADIFRPLTGTAILKVDGLLRANVAKLLPKFPAATDLHVYRNSSAYSLAWTVKTCEMVPEEAACVYYEISIYMGSLDGTVLKPDLYGPPELRSDYSVEEVLKARETYRTAKRIADQAFSALHPFGETDR